MMKRLKKLTVGLAASLIGLQFVPVAPVSWLIGSDVSEGRQKLNFSLWEQYDERRKARKLHDIVKEVDKGKTPPWYYVPLHPEAKLSPDGAGFNSQLGKAPVAWRFTVMRRRLARCLQKEEVTVMLKRKLMARFFWVG